MAPAAAAVPFAGGRRPRRAGGRAGGDAPTGRGAAVAVPLGAAAPRVVGGALGSGNGRNGSGERGRIKTAAPPRVTCPDLCCCVVLYLGKRHWSLQTT